VIGREKEIRNQVFEMLHDPKTRPADILTQIVCNNDEKLFLFRVYQDLNEFAIPERDLYELAKFVKQDLPEEHYSEFIEELRGSLADIGDQFPKSALRLHVEDGDVRISFEQEKSLPSKARTVD
jgi:hypothetical protein